MGSLRDIPDPPEMMLSTQASTTEDTIRSPTERCEADLRANRRAHGICRQAVGRRMSLGGEGSKSSEPGGELPPEPGRPEGGGQPATPL